MKVVFLQLAHQESDDRIQHQMNTLRKQGIECVYAQKRSANDGADVIICDTPKVVLTNRGFDGRVLYDVTEWYPSKKNLRPFRLVLRPLAAVAMMFLSFMAGGKADGFIFGEKDKGTPFRFLFPWKKYVYLPYYPSKKLFVDFGLKKRKGSALKVLYAGPLTEEKGYFRAKRVAEQCGVELTVVGPEQYMPLNEFCQYIRDFDVALDLRDYDIENRRCLPIKLFYYWAAGVVPIYSDLDAIRQHVPDVDNAALLVRSEVEAFNALTTLIADRERLECMSAYGREFFASRYNWESVEDRLTSIISQM